MVEQILDLAGAGSGRPLAVLPVPVARLVEHAVRSCEPELRAAGVEVVRDLPADLPLVRGDEAALARALHNLVDNAVKYAGEARWIRIAARPHPQSGRLLDVTVEDCGAGIDPADLPHVFEPFYRGRDAAAQGIRGSGIGLSLVRRIAIAHGGRVTVESRPGRTAFTLSLPVADA
jgi:signal transduction histidine kinase